MPSADLSGMQMQSAGFSRPSANLAGMASQSMGFVRRPPPVPAREPSGAPSAESLDAVRAPSIAHMNMAPGFVRQARPAVPPPQQLQQQQLSSPTSDADSLSRLQIDSAAAYSNVTPGFARAAPQVPVFPNSNIDPGFIRRAADSAPSSNYDGMMSQSAGFAPSANFAGMGSQQPGRVPMPSANYAGMTMQPAGAPVTVARVHKPPPQRVAPSGAAQEVRRRNVCVCSVVLCLTL